MSNIIVSPTSGVIEFNTGNASGASFYTSTAPIRLDATGGNSWLTGTNVGIGTNAPAFRLDVRSADDTLAYFKSSDNKASIYIADNDSAGYVSAENGYMSIGPHGGLNTGNININLSDGSVGIGTNSPVAKFEVSSAPNTNQIFLRDSSDGDYTHNFWVDAAGHGHISMYQEGQSQAVSISTAGHSYFNGGRVGIGTATPYGTLAVFSANNIKADPDDADNYQLHLHNPADDTDESIGIAFGITSAVDSVGAAIAHERKGSNSYGDLYFSTRPIGGSVTERMRITATGNVGIGTVSPSAKVHLNGPSAGFSEILRLQRAGGNYYSIGLDNGDLNFCYNGQSADGSTLVIDGGANAVGIGTKTPSFKLDVQTSVGGAVARFKDSDSSHEGIIIQGDTNGGSITNAAGFSKEVIYLQNSANAMRFYTDGTEAVRIDSSQRVGIGTNNPLYKLDVSGTIAGTSGNFVSGITIGGNPVMTGTSDTDVDTLQTVTDRGNLTTTSIVSSGPHISGATGLFGVAVISDFNSSDYAAFGHEDAADNSYAIRQHNNSNTYVNCGSSRLIEFRHANSTQGGFTAASDFFVGPISTDNTLYVDVSEEMVGIGTYAPAYPLHVQAAAAELAQIKRTNGGNCEFLINPVGGDAKVVFQNSGTDIWAIGKDNSDSSFRISEGGALETNPRFTVDNGGNVGIGTTDPSAQYFNNLVVGNDTAGDKGITIRSNASNKGVLAFSDTDSANAGRYDGYIAYGHTDNTMRFFTNAGNERMTIDNNGKVGIGNTEPADELQVEGQVRIDGSTTDGLTISSNAGASQGLLIYNNSDTDTASIINYYDGPLVLGQNNTEVMRLHSNGYVGIGTNNPSQLLNISGGHILIDHQDPQLMFNDIGGSTYTSSWMYQNNSMDFVWGGGKKFTIDSAGGVTLGQDYSTNHSAPSKGMIMEGNIGIRTPNPVESLHVSGNVLISGDPIGNAELIIDGATSSESLIRFKDAGSESWILRQTNSDNQLAFRRSSTDHVVINNGGHVGIGSATPAGDRLQVQAINDYFASRLIGAASAGQSHGLRIRAGYTSADRPLLVETWGGTDIFQIDGVGDVSGAANFYGTGVGSRITNNGTPYLLSGDAAAALTLQDVCDNGNTTTTAVGIGSASPSTQLDVVGTGAFKRINIYDTTYNANPRLCVGRWEEEDLKFYVDDMNIKITAVQDTDGDGDHRFILDREFQGTGVNSFHIANSGNYQLTIDKDNKIGMGYNSPSDFSSSANRLVIGDGAGQEGMTIYTDTSSQGAIYFADGTAGAATYAGYVAYRHAENRLDFGAGGGTRMVVNGNGAGIGTYTVDAKLTVSGAHSDSIAVFTNGPDNVKVEITDDADIEASGWISSHNTGTSRIYTSEIVGDVSANGLVMETDGAGNRTRLANYGTATD